MKAMKRAEEAAHSPDQRHGDDLAGEGHVERLRVDEVHQEGMQRPGQPRKSARDREGDHLVPLRVVADAVGAPLVLPGGQEHPAEGRAHQSPDQDDGHADDHRYQIVIRQRPCQVETGQGRALDPADAVLAARDRRGAVHDIEEHLCEGEREQREVDAALPHQKEADDRPHQHRGRRADQDRNRHALDQVSVGQGGAVGPDPEEGPMAEGEQAAVPQQNIERQGQQGKDQDLRGDGVRRPQPDDDKRQHEEECKERNQGVPQQPHGGTV
ncbi:MAG: hypothetical protein NTW68_10125 [candidate division NC10 bacterium]|nr:hypothetical protein [candidate division NC10 bacterium]